MAAVLACGDGAVLSHHSAAALWELLKPVEGAIHVSTPATSGRKSQRGIHFHRCPSLFTPREPSPSPSYPDQEGGRGRRLLITRRHRIPVTTVPRTIDDLEGTIAPYLLRRAIRQAEHKGHHLEGIESDRTRSDLETAFLALYRSHRILPPEVNVKLGRGVVDFLWREQRLVVEADFFTYHRGSVSFEDDHARDLDLRQQGFTVLRFTDTQLEEEPERVAADVAAALGRQQPSRLKLPPMRKQSEFEKSNEDASPAELIDARIAELGDWRGDTLARVRTLIHEADSEIVEEWKWRVPVWSHDGIICTGETYKKAVKLTFAKGASLEDPAGLFNSSLGGNTRRAIDIGEGQEIDAEALKALIREAAALNAA